MTEKNNNYINNFIFNGYFSINFYSNKKLLEKIKNENYVLILSKGLKLFWELIIIYLFELKLIYKNIDKIFGEIKNIRKININIKISFVIYLLNSLSCLSNYSSKFI